MRFSACQIQGRYRQLAEGQRHAVAAEGQHFFAGKSHTDALYSQVPLPAEHPSIVAELYATIATLEGTR